MAKPSFKIEGTSVTISMDGVKIISVDVASKTLTVGDKVIVVKDGIVTYKLSVPGFGEYVISSDGTGSITAKHATGLLDATVNFKTDGSITAINVAGSHEETFLGKKSGLSYTGTVTPISFNNQITFSAQLEGKLTVMGKELISREYTQKLGLDALDVLELLTFGELSVDKVPGLRGMLEHKKRIESGDLPGLDSLGPKELAALYALLEDDEAGGVEAAVARWETEADVGSGAELLALAAVPLPPVAGPGGVESPQDRALRECMETGVSQELARYFTGADDVMLLRGLGETVRHDNTMVLANSRFLAELWVDNEAGECIFEVYDPQNVFQAISTWSVTGDDKIQHYFSRRDGDYGVTLYDLDGEVVELYKTDVDFDGRLGHTLNESQDASGDKSWVLTHEDTELAWDRTDVNFDQNGNTLRTFRFEDGDNGWEVSRDGLLTTYDTTDINFDQQGGALHRWSWDNGDQGWAVSRDGAERTWDKLDHDFDQQGNDLRTFKHDDGDEGWIISRDGAWKTWDFTDRQHEGGPNTLRDFREDDGDSGRYITDANGTVLEHDTVDANYDGKGNDLRNFKLLDGDTGWSVSRGGIKQTWDEFDRNFDGQGRDLYDYRYDFGDKGWVVSRNGTSESWDLWTVNRLDTTDSQRDYKFDDGDTGWLLYDNQMQLKFWDTVDINPADDGAVKSFHNYHLEDGDSGWTKVRHDGRTEYHTVDMDPAASSKASKTVSWNYVTGANAGDHGWEDWSGSRRIGYDRYDENGRTMRHEWDNKDRDADDLDFGWEMFNNGKRTSWDIHVEQLVQGQTGWKNKPGGGVEAVYGFYTAELRGYRIDANNYGWHMTAMNAGRQVHMYEEVVNGVLETEHSLTDPFTGANPHAMFLRPLPNGITQPGYIDLEA